VACVSGEEEVEGNYEGLPVGENSELRIQNSVEGRYDARRNGISD